MSRPDQLERVHLTIPPDLDPALAAELRSMDGVNGDSPAVGRQLVPQVLSTVEPVRTRWAWEGRVPIGGVTLIPGRQGLGKSTLLTCLAADLSRGRLPGDLAGKPTTVLVASFEDPTDSVQVPRGLAAGADLDLVIGLDLIEDGCPDLLSLPGDLDLIADAARQYKAGALFIDPLMAALPGGIDSHRDQDVRRALAPLAQLAEEADLAVLAVLHLRKGAASEALDRVSGSVAFTAAARSVLAFGQVDEDEDGTGRVLAHAKSNLGPLAPSLAYRIESVNVHRDGVDIPTSRLVCEGECEVGAGELLSPSPTEDRTEVEIAVEWLADELADGEWRKSREIKTSAKATGVSERTLKRAKQQLGIEDRREGFPAVSEWRLAVGPGRVGPTEGGPTGPAASSRSREPNQEDADSQLGQKASIGPTGPTGGES